MPASGAGDQQAGAAFTRGAGSFMGNSGLKGASTALGRRVFMMSKPSRRTFAASGLALLSGAGAARAQTFPDRPIHMIIPLAAASAVDVVARIVAEKMSADLGQPIVVENQPGASGLVAMRSGARAAPDGYSILAVNDSIMTMLPNMKDDVGYDSLADFAPVTQIATVNFALIAHPSFAPNNVGEFIDFAKQKPGAIDYASGGPGSPQHVAMELLMHATGIKLNHVPYRGVTPAFNDVVGGQIPVMITGLPAPNDFVATGKLKMLAMTSATRSKVFPQTPTVGETIPGFEFSAWGAIVAPAKTPSSVLARLNQSAVKALRDPAVVALLEKLGFSAIGNTPDEFTASLKQGLQRYAELARDAHIHLD